MNSLWLCMYIVLFGIGLLLLAIARGVAGVKLALALLGLAGAYVCTGKFLGETAQWIFVLLFICYVLTRYLRKRPKHSSDSDSDKNRQAPPPKAH